MSGYDTLNFGYIPAEDSEIASFLRNTGGLVNIRDSSLPPTPGQILTAIDANNASWANLAEIQGWSNVLALNNQSGANDVIVQQKLEMPNGAATNTTALFNVTSGAGVPTSAGVRPGSLYFDDTANQLWIYDGAAWTNSFTSPTWAQVLLAGNTSGATNPTIDAAQQIIFTGDIMVGGTGIAASTAGANNIVMGRGAVNLGSANTIMGRLAKVNFACNNNVVVGDSALIQTDGAESTAMGYAATCGGADGLGNRTALGANSVCDAYNGLAAGNAATVLAGHHDSVALGPNAITTKANEIMLGINTGFVSVPGTLEMPLTQATNTTRLLNITTSDLGPPTSTALDGIREGSLYHDKLNSRMYMFSNGAWVIPSLTPTWAQVLATGNTSGATSPIISTGQALRFQTAGTINTVSGTDDITVNLGAGKKFYSDKTLVSAQQNGGAGRATAFQYIPMGAATVLDMGAADYSYDDGGASVVELLNNTIFLRKTDANYQINMNCVFESDAIPNAVLISHNARILMQSTIDGAQATFDEASGWFNLQPPGAASRISLNYSRVVHTSLLADQYIQAIILGAPIGRYKIVYFSMSAFLIN